MAQRRKRSSDKKEEFEYIDRESDLDESDDQAIQRKRSQAEFKHKAKQKKQDVGVVLIAIILIISTLGGYYVLIFNQTSDTGDTEETVTGNYTAELFIISDLTHNWDKNSWHIMNINGQTQFLLKVENTGELEDTFELKDDNKINNIKIKYNKNGIELKPGRSTIVIANITNTMGQEFRVPNPISIQLLSTTRRSIQDEVEINITIDSLPTEDVTKSGDKVSAFYSGSFNNGTLFDHSLKDPENKDPLRISLIKDQEQYGGLDSVQYVPVIEGFRRGLIGMVPGETRTIVVPPDLGYPSDHELGGEVLIFEVQLLSNDRNL